MNYTTQQGFCPLVSTGGVTVTFGAYTASTDPTGDYTPTVFGRKTEGGVTRFIEVGIMKTPTSMLLTPAEDSTNINWSVTGISAAPYVPTSVSNGLTSAEIVDELAGVKTIGSEKITFTQSEVLHAATFAQNDILTKLKLVDQAVRLALVSGQESYTFSPQTPVSAAADTNTQSENVGEVILTIPGHPYHDGDEVVVVNVGGGADGRWYVSASDANTIHLSGSVASGPVVSALSCVYHGLQAAIETSDRAPIRKVSSAGNLLTGFIKKKSHGEYETFRDEFGASPVAESSVINFMEEWTSPCITLQFQGTPGVDILVEVKIARRPLPCETLTTTVNPILPFEYSELLILGTKAFMYKYREEQVFRGMMYARRYVPGPKDMVWSDYQTRLKEYDDSLASRRVVFLNTQPGEGW